MKLRHSCDTKAIPVIRRLATKTYSCLIQAGARRLGHLRALGIYVNRTSLLQIRGSDSLPPDVVAVKLTYGTAGLFGVP